MTCLTEALPSMIPDLVIGDSFVYLRKGFSIYDIEHWHSDLWLTVQLLAK
jgi:hypothetical protein